MIMENMITNPGGGDFYFGLYRGVPPNRMTFHRKVPYNRVPLRKFSPTIGYGIYRMTQYSKEIGNLGKVLSKCALQ